MLKKQDNMKGKIHKAYHWLQCVQGSLLPCPHSGETIIK